MKIFGKTLFKSKEAQTQAVFNQALEKFQQSDFLIDFYRDTGRNRGNDSWGSISDYVLVPSSPNSGGMVAVPRLKKGEKSKKPKVVVELTPKGAHELKLLHDATFVMKTDPTYIDEQIEQCKEKLSMIKSSDYDMNYGTTELGSILSRLENRKKYDAHKAFFEEYPYTTNVKIGELVKNHSNLQMGQIAQFIADMPKEAVEVMKAYTAETKKLCDKKPVFYIVADKKDFKKTDTRRDPILLAQSPFGHFWQILGAWDDEMILVDEL